MTDKETYIPTDLNARASQALAKEVADELVKEEDDEKAAATFRAAIKNKDNNE